MNYDLVFIFTSSPYSDTASEEGLDALLAFAAFGRSTLAVYVADGVYQLIAEQAPKHGRNFAKMLQAFPIYDIEKPAVCRASLSERSVKPETLTVDCNLVDAAELSTLIRRSRHVMVF